MASGRDDGSDGSSARNESAVPCGGASLGDTPASAAVAGGPSATLWGIGAPLLPPGVNPVTM